MLNVKGMLDKIAAFMKEKLKDLLHVELNIPRCHIVQESVVVHHDLLYCYQIKQKDDIRVLRRKSFECLNLLLLKSSA